MQTLALSNLVVAYRYCAWCDRELGTRLFDARVKANQQALKSFGRIITNDMCPRCRDAIMAHRAYGIAHSKKNLCAMPYAATERS